MSGHLEIRRSELARIAAALTRTDEGRSSILVVEGEAGVGKTHLLEQGALLAADRRMRVWRSGLTEIETMLSWAGLSVLLTDLDEALLEGMPPPRRHTLDRARGVGGTGRISAAEVASALADVVCRVTDTAPLVLVLDDLQWIDRASAAAIAYAVRANAGRRVCVLAAHRSEEPVPLDLTRIPGPEFERIELAGLSAAGVHHLLAGVGLDVGSRRDLLRVHELSGGNPLRAVEIARRLTAGGPAGVRAVSDPFRDVTLARLDGLDGDAVEAARVCALMARPTGSVIAAVLGAPALAALAQLERRSIIRSTDGSIEFTHPLRRAAVLHGLGEFERRRLHLRIADTVDDPELAVLHRAESADLPDAELAAALERAGDAAAAVGVPDVAIVRYRRAAELTPEGDRADRWRRRHRVVGLSVEIGDHEAVLAEAEELERTAEDPRDVASALLHLIDARLMVMGFDAAIATARAGLERLPANSSERVTLLVRLVRLEQFHGFEGAATTARAALAVARRSGDVDLIRRAEVVEACAAVMVGDPIDTDSLQVPTTTDPHAGIGAAHFLAEVLVWTNQLDRAESMLLPDAAQARARGATIPLVRALSQLGDVYLRRGRWDEAERCLVEVGELADLTEYTTSDRVDLAWLAAARGDRRTAEGHLDIDAGRLAPAFDFDHVVHLARAGFVALCAGEWRSVVTLLDRAAAGATALGFVDAGALPFRHDLVEALLNLGEVEQAERHAGEFAAAAERSGSLLSVALGLRCRAMVASARGQADEAVVLAEQAVTSHTGVPVVLEAARTRLTAGSVLRRSGQRSAARTHLEAALQAFTELGARPFAERTTGELERLGARRVGPGLTATEERIARLAASGCTNAEIAAEMFVSLRTVESNLTRTYRKLAVRSRTELVAKLTAET